VLVGRVEDVGFDNDTFRAKVIMRIDRRYKFPKDSSVSILTSGLLGDQFVGIDGGADTELLEDGDRVRLTQSAIVLEKVIGQFLYGKSVDNGSKN
jgi:phospholipid/cholesterol/gamma-HCH transport system substrate-binding protein